MPVQFVGHPLVDLARAQEPKDSFLREIGLDPARPIVALLPGSRPNEVERLLPIMRDAVAKIAAQLPEAQFVIARAPSLDDRLFSSTKWSGVEPVEVLARTDDVLAISDVAITASGTATVQAALARPADGRRVPVVAADLPARPPVPAGRHVAMVNLIAGRRIVPELIQDDCTAENIAAETLSLLTEPAARRARRARALREVRAKLGGPGASGRAAEAVLESRRGARSRGRAEDAF